MNIRIVVLVVVDVVMEEVRIEEVCDVQSSHNA